MQRRRLAPTILSADFKSKTNGELRKDVKKRGLACLAVNATLKNRWREHDPPLRRKQHDERLLQRTYATTSTPGSHGLLTSVRLPDVSKGNDDDPKTQIPLVPDFWGAAHDDLNAEHLAPGKDANPIMITVADGPSHLPSPLHKLYQPEPEVKESSSPSDAATKTSPQLGSSGVLGSLVSTLADDFNGVKVSLSSKQEEKNSSPPGRELDDAERRGLYLLAGILGGSLLMGTILSPSSSKKQNGR